MTSFIDPQEEERNKLTEMLTKTTALIDQKKVALASAGAPPIEIEMVELAFRLAALTDAIFPPYAEDGVTTGPPTTLERLRFERLALTRFHAFLDDNLAEIEKAKNASKLHIHKGSRINGQDPRKGGTR